MRLSTFERVEKLYDVVEKPIEAGIHCMLIESLWDARAFDSKKTFYISNTKQLGAKNFILCQMYIVAEMLGGDLGRAKGDW